MKKLSITKETLAALNQDQAQHVAGGVETTLCTVKCTGASGCASCRVGCTTGCPW